MRANIQRGGSVKADLSAKGALTSKVIISTSDKPAWQGSYTYTPTDNEQIIPVGGMIMKDDIIIEAIPNNYGKIIHKGAKLLIV